MLPFQVSQVGHQELLLEAVELLSALVRIVSSLVGIVLYSTTFCLGDSQVFSNCRLHPLFTPNKETPISGFIADARMVIPNFVTQRSFHYSTPKPYPGWNQSVMCFDYIISFEVLYCQTSVKGGGFTYRSDVLASAKCI